MLMMLCLLRSVFILLGVFYLSGLQDKKNKKNNIAE